MFYDWTAPLVRVGILVYYADCTCKCVFQVKQLTSGPGFIRQQVRLDRVQWAAVASPAMMGNERRTIFWLRPLQSLAAVT